MEDKPLANLRFISFLLLKMRGILTGRYQAKLFFFAERAN